jgi:SAM-dependent methyltransferase
MSDVRSAVGARTVSDFGDQWTRYRDSDGYYGSTTFLADIFGPLLSLDELAGKTVADIGSGTGRIVNMLLDAGVARVTAVEPSEAFEVLKENTAARRDRIDYHKVTGEQLPATPALDLVVSVGVLHHIPEPEPVVAAAYRALRPGGRLVAWLYGREGNETYLRFVLPLRKVTTRLPHPLLAGLSHLLTLGVDLYLPLARRLPVPLAGYMNNTLGKVSRDKRRLTIYDQLNPAYARYYTEAEARQLFEGAGFQDVRLHHRHGYSWTVLGHKPGSP